MYIREEMMYFLLKKAREHLNKGTPASCPFCQLARLQELREGKTSDLKCIYCPMCIFIVDQEYTYEKVYVPERCGIPEAKELLKELEKKYGSCGS